jgi:hypothetical protein
MKSAPFSRFAAWLPALALFTTPAARLSAHDFTPDASGNVLVNPSGISGTDHRALANSTVTGIKGVLLFEPLYYNWSELRIIVTTPGYLINNNLGIYNPAPDKGPVISAADVSVDLLNSGNISTGAPSAIVVRGGSTTIVNYPNTTIFGKDTAITVTSSGGTVRNSGTIASEGPYAISAAERFWLQNYGVLIGGVRAGSGSVIHVSHVINAPTYAIDLLATDEGIGNNSVVLMNGSRVNSSIRMAGSGNQIQSYGGQVKGDISGVSSIQVLEGGSLRVHGNITGGAIEVQGGASLIGDGRWDASITLTSGSSIQAASAPPDFSYTPGPFRESGVMETAGNVTHAPGSSIIVNRGLSWFEWDPGIVRSVAGTYDAAAAIIDLQSGHTFANGELILVEAAGGTVIGGGNEIRYGGSTDAVAAKYFSSVALNESGDLVLNVNRSFASLPGLTRNQSALGALFDGQANGGYWENALQNFISLLDASDLGFLQSTFSGILSGAEGTFASSGLAISGGHQLAARISDHLIAGRAEADIVKVPVGLSSDVSAAAMVDGRRSGRVWGSFSQDQTDYDASVSGGDFDGDVSTFTAGVDFRIQPAFVIGLFADGSQADIDRSGDGTDTEALRAGVYAGWGESRGLYVDLLAGYGSYDWDLTDADGFQFAAATGYTFAYGKVSYGPFLGLNWQKLRVDGFDYTAVFPVSVEGYDEESLRGSIGLRAAADLGRFRPYASAAFAHEFGDSRASTAAAVTGLPLQLEGDKRSSAILLSLGSRFSVTGDLSLDLGYHGEIATDDEGLDIHGINFGADYAF